MQTLAAIGIVLATTLWAVGATPGNHQVVRVCLGTDLNEKEYALLPLVEAKTSKLFATIDIRLEWTKDRRYCHNDLGAIRLSVRRQAAPASGPDWLGYALPYDRGQIVAFYDRVVSSRGIVSVEDMLAYVFAHEIAHILEGISRHSANGIMKASWDNTDRLQMTQGSLTFAPVDIKLICDGSIQRVAILAAADQERPSGVE